MVSLLINFTIFLTDVLSIAIFIRAMLSWVQINNKITAIVYQITEPILMNIRKIIPGVGSIDISPMIAILILQLVQSILLSASR